MARIDIEDARDSRAHAIAMRRSSRSQLDARVETGRLRKCRDGKNNTHRRRCDGECDPEARHGT
jgi:hypothetical protein